MRINKYLALNKYSTRRGADDLISAGKVTINGRKAVLGDQVSETDRVEVDQKAMVARAQSYVYYAYNKPIGFMTNPAARSLAARKKSIADITALPNGVFPVGRLDEASHGLLILTNDGRVTDRLLSPVYEHEREYIVKVNKPISENFITRITKGVKIEDGITKPAKLSAEPFSKTFRIILTEGKKHQIRRMVTALGYEVTDLQRIRITNIKIAGLKTGEHRQLVGSELKLFLKALTL